MAEKTFAHEVGVAEFHCQLFEYVFLNMSCSVKHTCRVSRRENAFQQW